MFGTFLQSILPRRDPKLFLLVAVSFFRFFLLNLSLFAYGVSFSLILSFSVRIRKQVPPKVQFVAAFGPCYRFLCSSWWLWALCTRIRCFVLFCSRRLALQRRNACTKMQCLHRSEPLLHCSGARLSPLFWIVCEEIMFLI